MPKTEPEHASVWRRRSSVPGSRFNVVEQVHQVSEDGQAILLRLSSPEREQPYHVVFVTATSWPVRKDYGADGYAAIARALQELHRAPWKFTMITSADGDYVPREGMEILPGPDAVDCLDVFASAAVVIGNDTGLTHLAALTQQPDGTGPQVIGLYSRHAHNKRTTGAWRHHAVATPFSRMLALADRCPVRDQIDDAAWAQSATISALPAADIAGEIIRAGEGIILPNEIANRDAAVFPDSDRLDVHRDARSHMAFGFGVHQCLGQPLARVELQVVYGTLYRRVPALALAADPAQIPFKHDSGIYGVYELPVTW